MKPPKFLPALILILFVGTAQADTLSGRASVIDGDTIDIHGERIRLLDIDAPEARQLCGDWRCGQAAAIALHTFIGQHTVTCEAKRKDRYGRWLARCRLTVTETGDLSWWMAFTGHAVPYRDCKCPDVRAAAENAKAAKRGIWATDFQLPWEWRAGEGRTG